MLSVWTESNRLDILLGWSAGGHLMLEGPAIKPTAAAATKISLEDPKIYVEGPNGRKL